MSYANGTTHYNLPQTLGTDKRDWFDTNQAFADVDAALYAAATGQAADAEAIVEINQKLVVDEQNIADLQTLTSTHTSQISTLQTTVNNQANQITDTRQDAEDMISAYNEGAAETSTHAYAIGDYFIYNDVLYKATAAIAIGDTIVPNTNCEATNVTNEISGLNSNLSELNSTLNNGTVLGQVTSDGVKTNVELLNQLFTLCGSQKTNKSFIVVDNVHYYISSGSKFIANEMSGTSADTIQINFRDGNSTFGRIRVSTAGTVTYTDLASEVPSSGVVFRLMV